MGHRIRLLLGLAALLAVLAGCVQQQVAPTPPALTLLSGETLAPVDPALVSGPLEITGSSTVYPLTARIAEEFHAEGSRSQIDVKVTGTGGGFRSFCNGDSVDIVNASRPISDQELAACRAIAREPVGFQVGVDALVVVVSRQNTFVEALSFADLVQIFSGRYRTWNEVNPAFPAEPIRIYSPGVDSGTFDFFVEKVLGDRLLLPAVPGVVLSEDDVELVRGIEKDPYAIGYFGYAYYAGDVERLRALEIDAGNGPVAPGLESVSNGTYPLTRPLFIYTDTQTLQTNVAAAAFISYYLQHVDEVIRDVGYFAVSDTIADEAKRTLVATLQ
ncbi:MAG: phosphate ABC transporter substrate-binding protein PstS family protein [Chloroflexaceae bacterium]